MGTGLTDIETSYTHTQNAHRTTKYINIHSIIKTIWEVHFLQLLHVFL